MSVKSITPVNLPLKPSRRLLWVCAALHGLAALACLAAALPFWARALALAALLAGALLVWRRVWLKPLAKHLRVDETGEWRLWTGQGQTMRLVLLPGSIAVPWLILLRFRDENGRFLALPILPDSVPAEDFRRLAVWLRINAVKLSASLHFGMRTNRR